MSGRNTDILRSLGIWVLLIAGALNAFGQSYHRIDIPFRVNGRELALPLVGGLNNPQPNAVDLDNNGVEDLYVFDRKGDVQLTFINQGQPGGAPDYRYAPQFETGFPFGIKDWVLLRDYNGDGIMDLFTQAQAFAPAQGVIVYRGYYDSNKHIAFERVRFDNEYDLLQFRLASGGRTQIFISNVDYPAIDDLDCDGDLDILTFAPNGGYIELYSNQSIERGFGRDSLIFELTEDCWGGIFESSIVQEVGLVDTPGDCFNRRSSGGLHPGSTLLTFNSNGDDVKDLVIGDITFTTLNHLINGGSCEQAWIVDQNTEYPPNTLTADIPIFPAAFHLDLNNDGRKDLLASPNAANLSENRDVAWYYENTGSGEAPVFEFRQRDFLVEEMIDLGSGAYPAFVDYNADGLLDLVVGNIGFWQPGGQRDTRLFLFENMGTASSPAFELVDDNYLNLNIFDDNYSFAPTFGDLDNDGDMDVFAGEIFGQLFYAENTAGPGNPLDFGPWQYGYMDINIGQLSVPFIIDLNRDGLNDILVGERTGNINYFQNIGTPSAPMFNPDPNVSPNVFALGNINTAIPGTITGYSAPLVLDQQGTHVLVTGTEGGQLEFYNGIEGNINGTFNLVTDSMGMVLVGNRTRPAIADIDSDGKLEMIVGNERGGLSAYQTNLFLDSTSPAREHTAGPEWQVFPNPASETLHISMEAEGEKLLGLFNLAGQEVMRSSWQGNLLGLDVSALPSGLYYLRVSFSGKSFARKVVLK